MTELDIFHSLWPLVGAGVLWLIKVQRAERKALETKVHELELAQQHAVTREQLNGKLDKVFEAIDKLRDDIFKALEARK